VGRRGYPPEFRREVLDLVEAGRPIAELAQALGSAPSRSTPGGAKIASTVAWSRA
jgi:transposase-like protein